MIFAFRQSLAKKKVANIPPIKPFHHSQLPLTPLCATNSVTNSGVSAAKVVATIEVPAIHQGKFRPPKKKLSTFFPACLVKVSPTPNINTKNKTIINQSIICNVIVLLSYRNFYSHAFVSLKGRHAGLPTKSLYFMAVGANISVRPDPTLAIFF